MEISKRVLKLLVVMIVILLLVKLFSSFFFLSLLPRALGREAASIGIIGGADGPTAVYITGGGWAAAGWLFLLFVALDIILYLFFLVKSIRALRK